MVLEELQLRIKILKKKTHGEEIANLRVEEKRSLEELVSRGLPVEAVSN